MLTVEEVKAAYGDMPVLASVSVSIEEGEVVSLVGSNGSGKTTLLNCISGILLPTSGRVSFGEVNNIIGMAPSDIVNMGLIQVPEERLLFPGLDVLENLELGAFARRARRHFNDSLQEVFNLFPVLAKRKKQKAATLSGGEQQMLAIGRALMGRPATLMCDEPSLGLAPIVVENIFHTIKKINEKGVSIFLVEQNVVQALEMSHRGYVLENGSMILSGKGDELLVNEQVMTAYLGV